MRKCRATGGDLLHATTEGLLGLRYDHDIVFPIGQKASIDSSPKGKHSPLIPRYPVQVSCITVRDQDTTFGHDKVSKLECLCRPRCFIRVSGKKRPCRSRLRYQDEL